MTARGVRYGLICLPRVRAIRQANPRPGAGRRSDPGLSRADGVSGGSGRAELYSSTGQTRRTPNAASISTDLRTSRNR